MNDAMIQIDDLYTLDSKDFKFKDFSVRLIVKRFDRAASSNGRTRWDPVRLYFMMPEPGCTEDQLLEALRREYMHFLISQAGMNSVSRGLRYTDRSFSEEDVCNVLAVMLTSSAQEVLRVMSSYVKSLYFDAVNNTL